MPVAKLIEFRNFKYKAMVNALDKTIEEIVDLDNSDYIYIYIYIYI